MTFSSDFASWSASAPYQNVARLQRALAASVRERAINPLDPGSFFDLARFDQHLARFHPDAPVGDARNAFGCPLYLWRAAWVSAVGSASYHLTSGLTQPLPRPAQAFVILLDRQPGPVSAAAARTLCRKILAAEQLGRLEDLVYRPLTPALVGTGHCTCSFCQAARAADKQIHLPASWTMLSSTAALWSGYSVTPTWTPDLNKVTYTYSWDNHASPSAATPAPAPEPVADLGAAEATTALTTLLSELNVDTPAGATSTPRPAAPAPRPRRVRAVKETGEAKLSRQHQAGTGSVALLC